MGVFRFMKRMVKPMVDVPRWLDLKRITQTTNDLCQSVSRTFSIDKPTREESFHEACHRLGLREEDLQNRARTSLYFAWMFLAAALGMWGYAGYLCWAHAPHAGFMAFGVGGLLLGFSFRQHFWYTQIKHQVLGLTFKQWWAKLVSREETS